MKGVELKGILKEIFDNEDFILDKEKLNSDCQIWQGEKTCRYIMRQGDHYYCVKNTKAKDAIDKLVENNIIKSKGDNCKGL